MAEERRSGNPGNFAEDREKASRAGHVGGQHSSGNFANDRERAAEAGRKGGQASHGGSHGPEGGSRSGGAEHNPGNFAGDREKASAAGRKGGQSSHWMTWKAVEMNASADGFATLHEIHATFANANQMQDAVSKLSMSGFDRADLSLPSPEHVEGMATPEAGAKPASTEADARQSRTLGASTAGAAAALAAAGITVATGGAAAPAIAAAALAGGAAGGSVFAVHGAANKAEQIDRDDKAASGNLVLSVRTASEAKRSEAESILRTAGATAIEAV
jgi:general stress protein YciG